MTPRDALHPVKNAYTPSSASTDSSVAHDLREQAHRRLATLKAEVEALSVEAGLISDRTQPRRDPTEALRWLILSDATALVLGLMMSWAITVMANALFLDRVFAGSLMDGARIAQYTLIGGGVLMWLGTKGHYRLRKPFWLATQQIITAFGSAVIIDGFFQFASKQDFSRLWLVSGWLFAAIAMIVLRAVTRGILRRRGLWQIRALLVGSGPSAEDARAALRSEPGLGYNVVMQIENLPLILAQVGQSWEKLCDRFNADYVVIAMDGVALAQAEDSLARLSRSGIPFSISPPLRHLPVLGMSPQYFFNHDVMLMTPASNLEQPWPRFLKRTMDILASACALLVFSPVMLTLAVLVRRDGGPALFGHGRIGLGGKTFGCLKFRSMVMNSDVMLKELLARDEHARKEWMATQKLRHDPRVTRIGAFMRKWSLDELPQLINVLKGDMSLVGPRPVVHEETLRYEEDVTLYYRVRPGLTGLWQVSGRSDVSFDRRVHMDSWYVRNWSLWHDLAIICKTFPVLLKKTGAY